MLVGNGKKELEHIKGSSILNIVSHLFSTNICSSSSHHEGFCKFEIELRFTLVMLKTCFINHILIEMIILTI